MTEFLLLAFIFLVAGVFSVPIAARLGLGSVLGYLIAGIVIGPVLALFGVDVVSIQHFAEFGVVMMLFLVGLELEPRMLWNMRMRLLGLGGGQILVTTLVVMGAAMLLGQPWPVGLAVGLVLALSSTAIVIQTLNERGLMRSDGGQASFSVLLTQDIGVIPMLALIPLLAMPELMQVAGHAAEAGAHGAEAAGEAHGPGLSLIEGLPGWQTALVTVGAIGVVVLGGIYLTSPVFRFIAGAGLREIFVATALMMVVGIALLMSLVGLSPALGTFLAGVVLANSEYRHELESDIDPFRGLLLGLFFMTVGAGINFVLLYENLLPILGLTLGLILVKGAVLYALGTIFRLRDGDRWLFALGLAQAGEFGFVLLSFTVANAVIPPALADRLLLVVALSMLLTPGLFILYDRVIAKKFSGDQAREGDAIDERNAVIIAGAGRVGNLVNRILRAAGYETTVIDYNSRQLELLKRFRVKTYFGDASRPDMLHAAGIAEAKLFVVAIDDKAQITEIVRHVIEHYPQVHVMARAVDRSHVYDLWYVGCRDVIRETYDSTLRMGRSAFEVLGATRDQAERMVEAFNRVDREAMVAAAESYDPTIPLTENQAHIDHILAQLDSKGQELEAVLREIRAEARKESA